MSALASSLRYQKETSAIIEQQIQRWLLHEQANNQSDTCRQAGPSESCGHYIAISREAGASGEQIARAVSERVGWNMLDRELLALVAKAADCSQADIEMIDETGMRWITEFFENWIEHTPVSYEKYLLCLGAVMRQAARQNNVVIVGRGARFLLPREEGLSVRVIASKAFRIAQVERVQGLTAKQAQQWVEHTDRNRRAFVEQHFHHDPNNLHLYDLVINVEKLGVDGAARQIADAARTVFELTSVPLPSGV